MKTDNRIFEIKISQFFFYWSWKLFGIIAFDSWIANCFVLFYHFTIFTFFFTSSESTPIAAIVYEVRVNPIYLNFIAFNFHWDVHTKRCQFKIDLKQPTTPIGFYLIFLVPAFLFLFRLSTYDDDSSFLFST